MDWSGDGRWTGTHAARQDEPGHGTAVAMAVLGSGTRGKARQGWSMARLGVEAGDDQGRLYWGSRLVVRGGGGGGGGGGGFRKCDWN